MNHAITIGGLMFSIGLFGGVLTFAFGALSLFANMMADAQGDGGKTGCICMICGALIAVACLLALFA